jgi:hypothetical protein
LLSNTTKEDVKLLHNMLCEEFFGTQKIKEKTTVISDIAGKLGVWYILMDQYDDYVRHFLSSFTYGRGPFIANTMSKLLDCPLEDMPLYINMEMGDFTGYVLVAKWRLKIGK